MIKQHKLKQKQEKALNRTACALTRAPIGLYSASASADQGASECARGLKDACELVVFGPLSFFVFLSFFLSLAGLKHFLDPCGSLWQVQNEKAKAIQAEKSYRQKAAEAAMARGYGKIGEESTG